MAKTTVFALLLAGLFLVPFADAATSIEAPSTTTTIPYGRSGSISLNVTVDCIDFIEGATPTITPTISVEGPEWVTSDGASATFNGQDCLLGLPGQQTSLTQSVTIPVTTTTAAPGRTPTEITIASDDGASTTTMVQSEYKFGYEFVHDAPDPIEVDHDPVTFNASIVLTSNARTMAMFNIDQRSEFVSVSGLPSFRTVLDDELAGDQDVTIDLVITVTPPESGTWEADQFCFTTWSHFLDDGNMKTEDESICWNFVPAHDGHEDEDEGAPGFSIIAGLAALGAVAALARRRP